MSNNRHFKVSVIGKRGRPINLTIEDVPLDEDLRACLVNPNYQADWKEAYLTSYYEETLNDRRQSRSDRFALYQDWMSPQKNDFDSDIFINSLLSKLTKRQALLVRACIIEGNTYTQMARLLGINESSVRKSVKAALKKLKKQLS